MSGTVLLVSQALLYFAVMAALFRLRRLLGLGVFLCALGVMHFLETYLAAVFYIELPFGLLSPGSTVLFSGKLAILLLFYIREDAEAVRQPIYGLLIGNFLMVALVATLQIYGAPVALPGYKADLALINQMGMLMIWGTTLLFVDAIAMILIYEKLRVVLPRSVIARACISLALILSFDQVAFFAGLHLVAGTPFSALFGGWVAKMAAAALYGVLIGLYLVLFERKAVETAPQPLSDTFHKLTYRHKYEELLGRTGHDALTGALTRERFEALGQPMLARALAEGRPMSVVLFDIDHYKGINDRFGHVVGDEVLRRIVGCVRGEIRSEDMIFRYGGEEFVVLCAHTPHAAAVAAAERMRLAVHETLAAEFEAAPTISIGVATGPDDGSGIRELVAHADVHLYEAKRQGRNRVIGNRPASGDRSFENADRMSCGAGA